MLNHEMLKRVKVEESEEEGEDDKETLIESTDIADPVKNAVDISIDAMKVEIELISYLQVNWIWKLVRPNFLCFIGENSTIVLRQCTKLIVLILKLEIG